MQNKIIGSILGGVLILGMRIFVYATTKPPYEVQVPATSAAPIVDPVAAKNQKPAVAPAPSRAPGLSMADVARHSSRSDCWSVVGGSVYNLTSWIPNHPGGEGTILSMCGRDGTALYRGQHGSKSKPARILGGFKLGELAK